MNKIIRNILIICLLAFAVSCTGIYEDGADLANDYKSTITEISVEDFKVRIGFIDEVEEEIVEADNLEDYDADDASYEEDEYYDDEYEDDYSYDEEYEEDYSYDEEYEDSEDYDYEEEETEDDGEYYLIDVRQPGEHYAASIPGSVLIARGLLEFRIADEDFWMEQYMFPPEKDSEIYIYCKSGKRGILAVRTLMQLGYTNVKNLVGGYAAFDPNQDPNATAAPSSGGCGG